MTMLVMGSVIGVGIFAMPSVVAKIVHVPGLALLAWVLAGLVMLAGSLVYADLARRRPHVGGQYAFLREAYHPAVAFVYGWALLWIIQSGGMASVAVVFAKYLGELVNGPAGWAALSGTLGGLNPATAARVGEAIVAAVAIVCLTAVNCAGVRAGSTTQNIFMILKILAILMLVLCGLLVIHLLNLRSGPEAGGAASASGWAMVTLFGAALVQVFFPYGGWHTTTFVAGEVREPRRTLPRGLVLGVSGVIILYLAINVVCLGVLGVDELARNDRPAAAVMERALGATGAVLISAGITISAIGFLSQAMLTSPRVYYAMARDGLFLPVVASVHPKTRAPVVAVLLQGLFAMVIALLGTFEQIVNYVMIVEMTFWSLTALSLFIIRRRDAAAGQPGSGIPGHPWTTLLFTAVNVALILNQLYNYPVNSALDLGIALLGVPVYFGWRWLRAPAKVNAGPSVS